MAEPVKGNFVGRFALKFVEVLGAGIATAVGSYMVAQLSGYWSTTNHLPAAVHVVPSTSTSVTPSTPNASVISKAPRADADGVKPAPDAAASAVPPPARTTATANPAVSRKRAPAEANAEAKPPEKEIAKPPEKEAKAPEAKVPDKDAKPQDKDDKAAIEAQVRAALANVDASHPPAAPQTNIPPAAVPKVETPPGSGNGAAVPRAADAAPSVQPVSSPAPATPLTPVEIKSHPIADVDLAAQGDMQAKPEAAQSNDKGVFAAFKKIPEFFRTDTHPVNDPPRPPQSVGD
jgi:hypothetical protein